MKDDLQIIVDKLADVITNPMSLDVLDALMEAQSKLDRAMCLVEYHELRDGKKVGP